MCSSIGTYLWSVLLLRAYSSSSTFNTFSKSVRKLCFSEYLQPETINKSYVKHSRLVTFVNTISIELAASHVTTSRLTNQNDYLSSNRRKWYSDYKKHQMLIGQSSMLFSYCRICMDVSVFNKTFWIILRVLVFTEVSLSIYISLG